MEKAYKNIVLFFISITAIVFIGFYPTYYRFFPQFEGFVNIHHFHGALMVSWLFLLVIQPVLIKKRNFKWHRLIGRLSFFLVPLIILSMLLVYRRAISNSLADNGVNHELSLNLLFMPLTDILPFTIFYGLAIYYRKRVANHMRFMIATGLVVVGSGLVRIFGVWFGLGFLEAIYANAVALSLGFLALILYDIRHKKLAGNKSFVLAFIVFTLPNMLIMLVPQTGWWRNIARGIVEAIF